jgi:hypothetical protein
MDGWMDGWVLVGGCLMKENQNYRRIVYGGINSLLGSHFNSNGFQSESSKDA